MKVGRLRKHNHLCFGANVTNQQRYVREHVALPVANGFKRDPEKRVPELLPEVEIALGVV